MAKMATTKKNEKIFLPDVSKEKVVEEYLHHMHDMCEGLVVRIAHAPGNVWYVMDDVKHVFVDIYHGVDQAAGVFKKLLVRDVTKMDGLEILDKPCSGVAGPVLFMESYSWTSLCILAYRMGMLLGTCEWLASFVRPVFPWYCSIATAVALIFYLHARLRKEHWPEDEQRSACFHTSALFGMLMTYSMGMPQVKFAQFLDLMPMWIGMVAGCRELYKPSRMTFLNLAVMVPFGAYVLYAALTMGVARSFVYILAWAVMCAVIAVDLQLKLARLKRKWASKEMEQWESTAVFIVMHFALSKLIGVLGG